MISAKGHQNITAKHKTTVEFSKDDSITLKADCVIGVSSVGTELDFLKSKVKVELLLKAGNEREGFNKTERIIAYGHPDLTCEGFIVRKSNVIDKKTLCIRSDKSAFDLDRSFVESLKNPNTKLIVEIRPIGIYDTLDFYEGIDLL